MYLTKNERALLEATLFNLRFGANCAEAPAEMLEGLSCMTDSELEAALNSILAEATISNYFEGIAAS